MDNYITKFTAEQHNVSVITNELKNMVITDRESRDEAFEACKQANTLRGLIDNRRKKFLRPIAFDKKKLKLKFEKDCEPLDELKKNLEAYAKNKLLIPLEAAIATRKRTIIDYDDKMRREEADRLAEIERKKKEAEAKHIADLKKAEEKTGIAQKIAFQNADIKIESQKEELVKEEIDLTSKKSGREKSVKNYELVNINQVPERYLKPREVDWTMVKNSSEGEISGIEITITKELMFI